MEHSCDARGQFLGARRESPKAGSMFDCEFRSFLRRAANIDFWTSTGRERRVQPASFDVEVLAVKRHFRCPAPKPAANGKKFIGTVIAFVVTEEVAIIPL